MSKVAYFSMEIGVDPKMPTYSGGLGMLAGDSIRSAADLGLPMVAVTLLSRRGYFRQNLDASGSQAEQDDEWRVEDHLRPVDARAIMNMGGRKVHVGAWRYDVRGCTGAVVPVLFLDTRLPENHPDDQAITDRLYGGDRKYRLMQEGVLGVGGVRILRSLGYGSLQRFHMNEGHAALLVAELLQELQRARGDTHVLPEDIAAVKKLCVFTTHTPVPAGHDKFPRDMVRELFGVRESFEKSGLFEHEGELNMTYAALNLSHYVNGVAKRHGEVSREMFPHYAIDSITNGVHAATWVSYEIGTLLDRHIPDWRRNNFALRHALSLSGSDVAFAHGHAKRRLLRRVSEVTGVEMDPLACTIGFARRATPYKRMDLLLHDPQRLARIAKEHGPLQIVYAGKAHPRDEGGKAMIRHVFATIEELHGKVKMVYLPGYDFTLCQLMVQGCDVWLNTPLPPLEASGTSGMKAALNGVPHLSVLDGWWVEGCIEGVTGWAIDGDATTSSNRSDHDAESLYQKLETKVLPTFHRQPEAWATIMKSSIALSGSYFNTQRMMGEYVQNAYFRGTGARLATGYSG